MAAKIPIAARAVGSSSCCFVLFLFCFVLFCVFIIKKTKIENRENMRERTKKKTKIENPNLKHQFCDNENPSISGLAHESRGIPLTNSQIAQQFSGGPPKYFYRGRGEKIRMSKIISILKLQLYSTYI